MLVYARVTLGGMHVSTCTALSNESSFVSGALSHEIIVPIRVTKARRIMVAEIPRWYILTGRQKVKTAEPKRLTVCKADAAGANSCGEAFRRENANQVACGWKVRVKAAKMTIIRTVWLTGKMARQSRPSMGISDITLSSNLNWCHRFCFGELQKRMITG